MPSIRAVVLTFSAFLFAGCVSPFGTPSLKHGAVPFLRGPKVEALVVHANCELARAIFESLVASKGDLDDKGKETPEFTARKARWAWLNDANFVASVDFTLTATNSEGFDPSVSWITPTTALDKEILPTLVAPVPTAIATGPQPSGATTNTYNRTLAVGIQANGSQDRNFDLTYQLDLHRIYAAVLQEIKDSHYETDADHPKLTGICSRPHDPRSYTGLEGDLELSQTVDFGLQGLQIGKDFAYGAEGPAPLDSLVTARPRSAAKIGERAGSKENDVSTAAPHTSEAPQEAADKAQTEAYLVNPATAGTPAAAGTKTAMGPQSTNTTFSSKIDFTIIQGVNGGPSWTLLKWKIGGGGSSGAGGGGGGGGAGGAGGGGGAAAGGGAGAGGGGGGQMFNWSRTVLDTLTITFAPTCSSTQTPLDDAHHTLYWNRHDKTAWIVFDLGTAGTLTLTLPKEFADLRSVTGFTNIVEPTSSEGPSPQYIEVPEKGQPDVYGSLRWRGFMTGTAFELLGTITDPVTNNAVGAVVLEGHIENGSAVFDRGHLTRKLHEALSGGQESTGYWDSIQSCDLTSAAQIQASVKNASDTNTLFKLSNADRERLQQ